MLQQHFSVFLLADFDVLQESRLGLVACNRHYADGRKALAVEVRGEAAPCGVGWTPQR